MRRRRASHLRGLIARIFAQQGQVRVIDVGGTRYYWNIVPKEFLMSHRVQVLLVNLPGVERGEPDEVFSYKEGDGRDLRDFSGMSFDLVHSNSVIEHVGIGKIWKGLQRKYLALQSAISSRLQVFGCPLSLIV